MNAMTIVLMIALAAGAALTVGSLAGCKDQAPQSDLDRFIARTAQMEGPALQTTMRSIVGGATPDAKFANYVLGNTFYAEATDSSQAAGWNDGKVNALLDSAEVYFNRAVAQDSTFIEALVNLGSLWDDRAQQMSPSEVRDERLANAERFYKSALKTDPSDEKARCNLGALYMRQRRTQDALTEFQTAIANDGQSSLAHYNLAIIFAEAKIYREAIVEWELASKFDPQGDIGDRSRDNIKIVRDLMNAPTPDAVK
jgi:tetratricopeptide (TPR) repeat protein